MIHTSNNQSLKNQSKIGSETNFLSKRTSSQNDQKPLYYSEKSDSVVQMVSGRPESNQIPH